MLDIDDIHIKADARDPPSSGYRCISTGLYTVGGKKRIISMKSPAERWCNAPNAPLEPW
jgi:hypothetical protein